MKKILLSIFCVGLFLSSAVAETIQFADAVVNVEEDKGIEAYDARGNHFEFGKSEQGNPRIATGYAGSPVGEISFEAMSQDTVRFGIAGQYADIQRDPANPNKIYMTNPEGNEKISMESVVNEATGEVEVITRDENTGEILSRSKGTKDKSIDSVSNVNGHSQEIHLQKTGAGEDDYSGTMKMKNSESSADITFVNGEVQKGEISLVEGGYKKEFKLASGGIEVLLKEAKTNTLKYRVVSKNNYSRLYDANGNLIAEGPDGEEDDDDDEEKDMEKIYNQSAYNEFKQIMDADDDEEIEPPSISSLGGFFGF